LDKDAALRVQREAGRSGPVAELTRARSLRPLHLHDSSSTSAHVSDQDLQRPAPAGEIVSRFKGHSGCRVLLTRAHDGLFVRKIASDARYGTRLENQMKKQHEMRCRGLPCPRVLHCGEINGLFFFDMEYLPAVSVAEHIKTSLLFDENGLFEFVVHWITEFQGRVNGCISSRAFANKIKSVVAACRDRDWGDALASELHQFADRFAGYDWRGIPNTMGHGDMTLENLLIAKSGQFYFIDFGDAAETSSYMMDLAKLFQDFAGFWCIRDLLMAAGPDAARLNAEQALMRLGRRMLRQMAQSAPAVVERLPQLVALQLWRALPYCRDEQTARFILWRCRFVLAEYAWD